MRLVTPKSNVNTSNHWAIRLKHYFLGMWRYVAISTSHDTMRDSDKSTTFAMASIALYSIHQRYLESRVIYPGCDCNRFALKPLKWLRFLTYAIILQTPRRAHTIHVAIL